MKQLTKKQLKPLNDRVYEIIDELGGLKSDSDENEASENGEETAEEHNAQITYDAIQRVLKEVESSLVLAWYSNPSYYFYGL